MKNLRRETALAGLWHDYANLFPMLDAAGQDALRADIAAFGVREPVILYDGRILDGRNRYMAARDLGMDFPVADFDGDDAAALAYVLSTNLHRRHLTESQRATVAAKLANLSVGNPAFGSYSANLQNSDASHISQSEAAEMLSVSTRSVASAKAVLEHGAPELTAAVEAGNVSVSAAATISELPKEEQAAVVAEGPKAVKAKAKAVRKAKKAKPAAAPVDEPSMNDAPAEEAAPDPDAAERRKLAKLTPDALIDEVIGLRADLAEQKAKRKAAEAEARALKDKLGDHQGDKDEVIRRLQKTIDHKNSEMFRANEKAQAALKQVYALKKRVEELEALGIPLN